MTTTPENDVEKSDMLIEIRDEDVVPEVAALRSCGFRMLLEHGAPVEQEAWAKKAGVEPDTLAAVLENARARGRVEFDSKDRLVGIAGLTIEPTRHRLDVNGKERWTWCALDAMGILGALRSDGTVFSDDPSTGEEIEIHFSAGKPDGDAAIFILGGYADVNVKDAWCPMVNFFTSLQAAKTWVELQNLDGDVVSAARIAEEAAEVWRPVVRLDAPLIR